MAYWILQANLARYRLLDALAAADSVRSWTIARHRGDIAPGDKFALWGTGPRGGVYALGMVTAAAEFRPGDKAYWVDAAVARRPTWRVGIRVDDVLPRPILRVNLAGDPAFANSFIMRMPGGGNPFPVTDAEWHVIESWRSKAAGWTANTAASDHHSGLEESPRRPSRRGVAWTREEDILALDLFVHAGVVNGGSFLSETDPRVIALSDELRALPTHPRVARDERFRNPASVALKLMNFRAAEKATKLELGVPGADALPGGMPRYSAVDRAIFGEYYRLGFQGLAEDAQAVRGASQLGGIPAATIVQDRPVEDAGAPTYETAGAEGGTRSRDEHDLVQRYAGWLSAVGVRVVSRLYRVPGLARPFLCDAYLADSNALVEAKSSDRREAIRMAVGQLLDYRYLEGTQPKLGVLLPSAPAAEIRDMLDALGIGVIWSVGDGFRDSAGGAFTAQLLAPSKEGDGHDRSQQERGVSARNPCYQSQADS